jgi:hypothetical protein
VRVWFISRPWIRSGEKTYMEILLMTFYSFKIFAENFRSCSLRMRTLKSKSEQAHRITERLSVKFLSFNEQFSHLFSIAPLLSEITIRPI